MRRSDLQQIEELVRRVVREELAAARGGPVRAQERGDDPPDEEIKRQVHEAIARLRARARIEGPRREAAARARTAKWERDQALAHADKLDAAMKGMEDGPEMLTTREAWDLYGGPLVFESLRAAMRKEGYQTTPGSPGPDRPRLLWRRADVLALRRRDLLR